MIINLEKMYTSKYLKYKTKYLRLFELLGGADPQKLLDHGIKEFTEATAKFYKLRKLSTNNKEINKFIEYDEPIIQATITFALVLAVICANENYLTSAKGNGEFIAKTDWGNISIDSYKKYKDSDHFKTISENDKEKIFTSLIEFYAEIYSGTETVNKEELKRIIKETETVVVVQNNSDEVKKKPENSIIKADGKEVIDSRLNIAYLRAILRYMILYENIKSQIDTNLLKLINFDTMVKCKIRTIVEARGVINGLYKTIPNITQPCFNLLNKAIALRQSNPRADLERIIQEGQTVMAKKGELNKKLIEIIKELKQLDNKKISLKGQKGSKDVIAEILEKNPTKTQLETDLRPVERRFDQLITEFKNLQENVKNITSIKENDQYKSLEADANTFKINYEKLRTDYEDFKKKIEAGDIKYKYLKYKAKYYVLLENMIYR